MVSQHMWTNNSKGPDGAPWISGTGVYGEATLKMIQLQK